MGTRLGRGARRLQRDLLDLLEQVRGHSATLRRRLNDARTMSYDGLTVERAVDLAATDLDLLGGCIETIHRLLVTTYEELTCTTAGDGDMAARLAALEQQVADLRYQHHRTRNGTHNGTH